jgi:AAA+ superfamily predicted ATPase
MQFLIRNYPIIFKFFFTLALLYIPASIIYYISGFAYRAFVLVSAIVPMTFILLRENESRKFVTTKMTELVGPLTDYSAHTKSLPGYRFVDVYKAVSFISSEVSEWVQIESQHRESLAQILNYTFYSRVNRRVNKPEKVARPISECEEGFFPLDSFWLRTPSAEIPGEIIRVRIDEYTHQVILEAGAKEQGHAEKIIHQVLERASENSIFKNKLIKVSFEQEVKDSYGDIENFEHVDPIFLKIPPVTEDDIILDDDTRNLLQRSIIDFHKRREELIKYGVPGRRGVLFHGPPGTGKTYTSRYISNELESATTITASGVALLHIRSICNIARMLQPSVVILEDMDLVYSSRDNNVYTTALGELMDELDGFSSEDHIIFILTTNAIDRVEAAIRERPGRISQCISFSPPGPELRRLFFESMLAPFDCRHLNMNELISKTNGVTQAFLKELVSRAVQIATELQSAGAQHIALSNENFQAALDEMKRSVGRSSEKILGFRAEQ